MVNSIPVAAVREKATKNTEIAKTGKNNKNSKNDEYSKINFAQVLCM